MLHRRWWDGQGDVMARLVWNFVGLVVLVVAALAAVNYYTTHHAEPCAAAMQLRQRANQAPRPRPAGAFAQVACQQEVLRHMTGQITGRLPHDQ